MKKATGAGGFGGCWSGGGEAVKDHSGELYRVMDYAHGLGGVVDGLAAQADGGDEGSGDEQCSFLPFLGVELRPGHSGAF
jgi:hypothetical protein